MSAVLSSSGQRQHRRTVPRLFVVGGAATAALTLLVWALGYFASQPFGSGPGANPAQQALPNPYIVIAVVWAAAALAEVLGALLSRQRPRTAIVVVSAATAASLAALLATAQPIDYVPTLIPGLLAWLVPTVPLAIGVVRSPAPGRQPSRGVSSLPNKRIKLARQGWRSKTWPRRSQVMRGALV